MPARPNKPKLASGPKPIYTGSRVFVQSSLAAESPQKNPFPYDALASGRGVYAYASGNPISRRDPLGLWDWPSLPQSVVNASAGIGDALLLNQGARLRQLLNINGGVDTCSGSYKGGMAAGIIGSFVDGEGEANIAFQTEHYAADLIEQGVDVADAEAAVAAHLSEYASTIEGWTQAQVTVDGTLLNYRVFPLPGGGVSVGTIFTKW